MIPILPSEVMRSFSLFPFVLNWNESSDWVYLIAPLLLSVPVPSPKNIVPVLDVPENIVIPCSPLVLPTTKSSEPLSALLVVDPKSKLPADVMRIASDKVPPALVENTRFALFDVSLFSILEYSSLWPFSKRNP